MGSQITRVENSFSNSFIVKSRVQQGSVLGQHLDYILIIFLVYSHQKSILIYLPMIQIYMFLTHLRMKDFFYKII